MLWRYLGAVIAGAVLLWRPAEDLAQALEVLTATVAARAGDRLGVLAADLVGVEGAGLVSLVAASTPALVALILASATRVVTGVRRLLSVAVVALALGTFGLGVADAGTAAAFVGVAILMNLATGPLLIGPLSVLSAALTITTLRHGGAALLGTASPALATLFNAADLVGAATSTVAGIVPAAVASILALGAAVTLLRR
jgi:hypothetical protein